MADRNEWSFDVLGMTCDHCAKTIDETLRRVPGVVESTTRYSDGRARVIAEAATDGATLAAAITGKGYRIAGQKSAPLRAVRAGDDGERDLLIIGGGSAGFAAAIRAAELGASAAIVEAGPLGGTCVNVGCVPSKTLIRAAEVFHRAGHHAFAGIRGNPEQPDFGAVIKQKDELVATLQQVKYWDVLGAYPQVELLKGRAAFRPDGAVEVDGKPVRARKVLLAMGASPWAPPIPGLAETGWIDSTRAMSLDRIPRSLIVLGAGAIGLELGQVFARLGAQVTVHEVVGQIAPVEDLEVANELERHLRAEGIEICTCSKVVAARSDGHDKVIVSEMPDGQRREFRAEQLLVATGRRPNTKGMGLEEAGIRLGKKGELIVDEHLETTRKGVYAAGDVAGDPMFVYVSAYGGALAAENALSGNARRYDLSVVPRVTFTDPAVASVGLTEAQARERGLDVAVSKLPLAHVPRAIAARDTRGMIKLVADGKTNLLVGAHIVAPEAGEIIQPAAMMIRFGIRVDEVAAMLHPYLTLAEGIKLACQTFRKDVAKLSCCAA